MDKQYVIIIQKGELEIKALLLAFSLRKQIPENDVVVIAVPSQGGFNTRPSEEVLKYLVSNGFVLVEFENHFQQKIKREKFSHISNKFFALSCDFNSPQVVFLDSDIVCLNKPHFKTNIESVQFAAKQANYCKINNLPDLYDYFNIGKPKISIKMAVENRYALPYYNSGVMLFQAEKLPSIIDTAKDIYLKILSEELIKGDIFFADQVAFTLSVFKNCDSLAFLNEELNFPARSKMISRQDSVVFAHYHSIEALIQSETCYKLVNEIMNEHPFLKSHISSFTKWKRFFHSGKFYYTNTSRIKHKIKRMLSRE
jgi:hypothetical protein